MQNEPKKNTPRWRRWTPIGIVSPSGKTLFICLICGRMTPAPDENCNLEQRGKNLWGKAPNLRPGLFKTLRPGFIPASCAEIEMNINARLRSNIADDLRLDAAENELRSLGTRRCSTCHGYGCHVCAGLCVE